MSKIRTLAKRYMPDFAFALYKAIRDKERNRILANAKNRSEIFSAVYSNKMWGGSGSGFYSGYGSHDDSIVEPYIAAVQAYLESRPSKPDICDLGCGDFSVGSRLRPYCGRYIAADIVPELIAWNKEHYSDAGVEFRQIDIVTDPLPDADVVFIRQVFQHLSNSDIAQTLPKLSKYSALIVTEDVPRGNFTPNHDKRAGFDVRLSYGSGVDITEAPFNFRVKSKKVLFVADCGDNQIRTTLYEPD